MNTAPSAPSPTLRQALLRLSQGGTLAQDEMRNVFTEIMQGGASPAAVGGLLLAMRARGETPEEIAGAVSALRDAMQRVEHTSPDRLVDTCGTGGGEITTINLSTAAAFVAAAAGVPIAKHGNRSFTSRSGSADVLEALGLAIHNSPDSAGRILADVGLVFLFAPTYHPAMRHVTPVRQALGVPTLMNLIGPLANPASVRRQVVGVADATRAPLVAAALVRLDTISAWVVRGDIGMDEISPVGTTSIWEVRDGAVHRWALDPADVGLAVDSLVGLEGGEPGENASRIATLFQAPDQAAPALRAAVLLNAAAAIVVGGVAANLADGVAMARMVLHNGAAATQLEALRRAAPHPGVSTS